MDDELLLSDVHLDSVANESVWLAIERDPRMAPSDSRLDMGARLCLACRRRRVEGDKRYAERSKLAVVCFRYAFLDFYD